ncbi:MAG TPA: hypothetical protein VET88_02245, partial [Gammaproteobacteria bacterium]|nr:hypothetical protein [Gammaproteobacteria bacterium]
HGLFKMRCNHAARLIGKGATDTRTSGRQITCPAASLFGAMALLTWIFALLLSCMLICTMR